MSTREPTLTPGNKMRLKRTYKPLLRSRLVLKMIHFGGRWSIISISMYNKVHGDFAVLKAMYILVKVF